MLCCIFFFATRNLKGREGAGKEETDERNVHKGAVSTLARNCSEESVKRERERERGSMRPWTMVNVANFPNPKRYKMRTILPSAHFFPFRHPPSIDYTPQLLNIKTRLQMANDTEPLLPQTRPSDHQAEVPSRQESKKCSNRVFFIFFIFFG